MQQYNSNSNIPPFVWIRSINSDSKDFIKWRVKRKIYSRSRGFEYELTPPGSNSVHRVCYAVPNGFCVETGGEIIRTVEPKD